MDSTSVRLRGRPSWPWFKVMVPYQSLCFHSILYIVSISTLLRPQYPWTSSLRRFLLLVTLVKRHGAGMVPPKIIQVLDLVDSDDPVLTRESFFQCAKLWPLCGQTRSADSVLCLSCREKRIIVIVRHFVPVSDESAIAHSHWKGQQHT